MEQVIFGGDNPQPRFGHTICQISPSRIILFGGAVGDTGKYNITGDLFLGDLTVKKWRKLNPSGPQPISRAAHCAVQIELNQMIIFGGAVGGGGLADDNLFVFELKSEDTSQWIPVPIVGTTPGRRYGHTMCLVRPFLIIFGGNTGSEPINDVWSLNLEKAPYTWTKMETSSDLPVARVYHSAALCSMGSANGMMVIFGGRTTDQSALNDTWGLRRHRDGRWDWVRAPYKSQGDQPAQRYQHSTLFIGTLMMVIGGRSNQVGEQLSFEIYDTETSDWYKFAPIQRFRHATWLTDQFLYLHGGFDCDQPNIPTEGIVKIDLTKRFATSQILLKQLTLSTAKEYITPTLHQPSQLVQSLPKQQMETEIKKNVPNNTDNQRIQPSGQVKNRLTSAQANQKNIRLANQAIVATTYNPEDDISNMIKKVSIDKLQEEHKKLGVGFQVPNQFAKIQQIEQLVAPFLQNLFIPKEYQQLPPNANLLSGIKKDQIIQICDEVQKLFEKEPIGKVLKLQVPLKIFGSLNGQFFDLMRFFDHFKAPYDNLFYGDIDSYDYLFLGDYVDRGNRGLEVILLLFSLKIKHPDQIHLLRGHHEDRKVNKIFGFADECFLKLGEDLTDPNSIFQKINKVFEFMPLAALVEDKLFCVHGGIGQNIRTIEEIELIQRPLEIYHEPKTYQQKLALELLWSDPNADDETESVANTERDLFNTKSLMKFGVKRLQTFLSDNKNINIIIRSHEPVAEGVEKANLNLITIFSASDYGGQQNQGGMLTIKRNYEIITKLINPGQVIQGENRWIDLEEAPQRKKNFSKYILIENDEIVQRKRPITPIRRKVKVIAGKQFGK